MLLQSAHGSCVRVCCPGWRVLPYGRHYMCLQGFACSGHTGFKRGGQCWRWSMWAAANPESRLLLGSSRSMHSTQASAASLPMLSLPTSPQGHLEVDTHLPACKSLKRRVVLAVSNPPEPSPGPCAPPSAPALPAPSGPAPPAVLPPPPAAPASLPSGAGAWRPLQPRPADLPPPLPAALLPLRLPRPVSPYGRTHVHRSIVQFGGIGGIELPHREKAGVQ